MENAEKKIFDIMQEKNQKGYSPIKDVLVESFNKLEELVNLKDLYKILSCVAKGSV